MTEQLTRQAVVRQIVFTHDAPEWGRIMSALGAQTIVESPEYDEFVLPGGGLLGVHEASSESPVGTCALQIVVPDLDDAREALHGLGVQGVESREDFGRILDVGQGPLGPDVTLVEGAGPDVARAPGELMATPLSLVRDVEASVRLFEVLALDAVLRSNAGTYVEMTASGGGEVLVHDGSGGAALSFQVDDLVELERRCEAAGLRVDVVDEAYGRTALVEGPDGQIWVNERQRDFYGYEPLPAGLVKG